MLRLTPMRILSLLRIIWLLTIIAWYFLPSPPIAYESRDQHVQTVLRDGRTLSTVHQIYPTSGFDDSEADSYDLESLDALIIDWRLISDKPSASVLLQVGRGRTVNLTHALLQPTHNSSGQLTPYTSDSIQLSVYQGRNDGSHINMQWFDRADQVLFDSDMHQIEASMSIEVEVSEPNQVLVFADSIRLNGLLSQDLTQEDREDRLLASFSNVSTTWDSRSSITSIRISGVKGRLPSRTYFIRRHIQTPVVLSFIIVGMITSIGIPDTVLAAILVIMACWAIIIVVYVRRCRQPGFCQWYSEFWMTSWMFCGRNRKDPVEAHGESRKSAIYNERDDLEEKANEVDLEDGTRISLPDQSRV